MRIRNRLWLIFFSTIFLILVVRFWWQTTGPGPNAASFQRIEVGMSRDEVWKIMGGPPRFGIEVTGQVVSPSNFRVTDRFSGDTFQLDMWISNSFSVDVFFDREGKAVCRKAESVSAWSRLQSWVKDFMPVPPKQATKRATSIRPTQ